MATAEIFYRCKRRIPDIDFVIPAEGTSIACDDLVIPKDSQESKLAHAFINFIHDPDVAAENTNFLSYVCPNQASYAKVDPALRNNPAVFLAPEVKAKCEVIDDLGPTQPSTRRIWDQIKAAD